MFVYHKKIDDFITYGSDKAKATVNITSVFVAIIIAFRLNAIFTRRP